MRSAPCAYTIRVSCSSCRPSLISISYYLGRLQRARIGTAGTGANFSGDGATGPDGDQAGRMQSVQPALIDQRRGDLSTFKVTADNASYVAVLHARHLHHDVVVTYAGRVVGSLILRSFVLSRV